MKTRAIIAVTAVGLIGVGFAFGLANVFRDDDTEAVIKIARAATGGQCAATTYPEEPPLRGHRWKNVIWRIEDPSSCLTGETEVELRFEGDDSPFYVKKPKHKTEIKRRVKFWARVKTSADYVPYKYKVWAVNGTEYEMEDPELEIVY
jgi:hypothetical protein